MPDDQWYKIDGPCQYAPYQGMVFRCCAPIRWLNHSPFSASPDWRLGRFSFNFLHAHLRRNYCCNVFPFFQRGLTSIIMTVREVDMIWWARSQQQSQSQLKTKNFGIREENWKEEKDEIDEVATKIFGNQTKEISLVPRNYLFSKSLEEVYWVKWLPTYRIFQQLKGKTKQ